MPRFEGRFVYLREAKPEDAGLVARWKADPELRSFALAEGPARSVEEERSDIERASADDRQMYLLIVRREGDLPVGYVRINWMEDNRLFAWLRFSIGEADDRRRGFCSDALRALIDRLFEQGTHRFEAEAYEENTASRRLLEGLGFLQEGLKREAAFRGGSFGNIVVYGLVRTASERAKR